MATTEPKQLETVNDYIEANLVHSLHVSERRSFRGCRRRWSWIFRDMWYPYTTAKPLEFGIAYHKACEFWYDPDFSHMNESSFRQTETLMVFRNECRRQLDTYRKNVRDGHIEQYQSDEEIEQDYSERVELGIGMLKQMFRQSLDLDKDYTPKGVEVKFEVPIKSRGHEGEQLWCKCTRCWKKWTASLTGEQHMDFCRLNHGRKDHNGVAIWDEDDYKDCCWRGLPVCLGGRIDMFAEDIFGRYWIFDWKTAARLSTGEPGAQDDFLWLDDQITSYCWAMWVLGLNVAGFVYHEQKKALPEEPEPLKRPYKGAVFSTNKSKSYEYDTYFKTVSENDPMGLEAGVYDDFLAYLKAEGGVFYKRHVIIRTVEQLVSAGQNLALEALDIVDPGLRIYPAPGRYSCNGCAFREPCLARDRGEDVDYTLESLFEKREKLYYEIEPSNTDKSQRS